MRGSLSQHMAKKREEDGISEYGRRAAAAIGLGVRFLSGIPFLEAPAPESFHLILDSYLHYGCPQALRLVVMMSSAASAN